MLRFSTRLVVPLAWLRAHRQPLGKHVHAHQQLSTMDCLLLDMLDVGEPCSGVCSQHAAAGPSPRLVRGNWARDTAARAQAWQQLQCIDKHMRKAPRWQRGCLSPCESLTCSVHLQPCMRSAAALGSPPAAAGTPTCRQTSSKAACWLPRPHAAQLPSRTMQQLPCMTRPFVLLLLVLPGACR